MKKNNNIKQLKKWMINRSTDKIECYVYGVQAYNISANEYEVIVAYQKINGRYYFIDRDGNKYLASRYDRAEQVAGEIVENVNNAVLSVISSCNELQTKGQTVILEDVKDLFLEFSAAIGLEFEVKKTCSSEFGESTITYILKGDNNAQSEETASDEQQTENEESNEQNNEQNAESEAACEPSKFAGILAKVKSGARKVCEKVALIMALAFVMVVTFAALFGMVYFLPDLLDLFGIECGSWAAISLSLLLFCTVIMDTCVFVELNTMAAIDYLFPSLFGSAQKPGFIKPFSFWRRVFASDML